MRISDWSSDVCPSDLLDRTGLRELKTIDPAKLSGMDLVNYETFRGPWEHYVEAYDTFDYGLHSWPEPHPVTQLSGTYRSIPDFLVNQHSIANAADAEDRKSTRLNSSH